MGMLRLFLPHNKVQFNLESQKESVNSVKTQQNMRSSTNTLGRLFRPREFLGEFLGKVSPLSIGK